MAMLEYVFFSKKANFPNKIPKHFFLKSHSWQKKICISKKKYYSGILYNMFSWNLQIDESEEPGDSILVAFSWNPHRTGTIWFRPDSVMTSGKGARSSLGKVSAGDINSSMVH